VAVAARLFDWTVRNIQLNELLPYPTADAEPSADGEGEAPTASSPLLEAKAGPGYTTYPWQTLTFGRGDAWQRARVFILLARQRQIDVVMLAFDDTEESPRPWLPAALIDDQLYLFDTSLGLPIPGPGGFGIATLEQVRKDRSLLSELDVGEHTYAPAEADFDKVVALIDASPNSLSRRMRLIDSQRAGGQQLVLSANPSGLAERLRQCSEISNVELWRTPYETWVYRTALSLRSPQDPELIRRLMLDEWIFDGQAPLVLARQLHFRGRFENEGQKEGAKAKYFAACLSKADIDRIETSPELQRRLGIVRNRENDQQWQAVLQTQKLLFIRAKRNASYWLGLIHYETGGSQYEPALYWLKTRTLEAAENGPWTAGARYNLSRVYEATGDLREARNMLLLDDSPQKHGNLLRARFLRKKLEAQEEASDGSS